MRSWRRSRRVWVIAFLLGCGVASALPGCGTSTDSGLREISGDPRVFVQQGTWFIQDIAAEGRLRYQSRNRCLFLGKDRVVWPAGTTPVRSGDLRGVDVPGFGVIYEGSWVVVHGGDSGVGSTDRPDPDLDGLERLDNCPSEKRGVILVGGVVEVDSR